MSENGFNIDKGYKHFFHIVVLLLLLPISVLNAQPKGEEEDSLDKKEEGKAYAWAKEAVALMDDKGNYDKALHLLKKALKLDPDNAIYLYEMAYAYYYKKAYRRAIKTLKKSLRLEDILPQSFALLANVYEAQGNKKKYLKTYLNAIEKFPGEGSLYQELGGYFYQEGNNDKAVDYWELGIKNAPDFAGNYFWATQLYCRSSEKLWGILYGEIFMNLEPNTLRTVEISRLLYDSYCSAIHLDNKKIHAISFSERSKTLLMLEEVTNENLPFQVAFDLTMHLSMPKNAEEKNIALLLQLRKNFLNKWYEAKLNKKFNNVLFDYLQKMNRIDQFDAYTYWLFQAGNKEEFEAWKKDNRFDFNAFIIWFKDHPFLLNTQQKFFRKQYVVGP